MNIKQLIEGMKKLSKLSNIVANNFERIGKVMEKYNVDINIKIKSKGNNRLSDYSNSDKFGEEAYSYKVTDEPGRKGIGNSNNTQLGNNRQGLSNTRHGQNIMNRDNNTKPMRQQPNDYIDISENKEMKGYQGGQVNQYTESRRANEEPYVYQGRLISDEEFDSLFKMVHGMDFSSSKAKAIKLAFPGDVYITSKQVKKLVKELDFDSDKKHVCVYLYRFICDKNNFTQVLDVLDFDSSKIDVLKGIRK
jgi:hypothetical protein